MAVGMEGFIGIGVESSAGTASFSVAIVDFLPFQSENLAVVRNDLPDPSIWANFDERRMYNGLQRIEGSIQTVFHPILTGYLLRLCFDVTTAQRQWLVTSQPGAVNHRFWTSQGQFQTGSGSDLPTATIEVNRGPVLGAGSSFMYYNCTGNALELSIDAGGFVQANVDMVGRDFSGKSRSTPTYLPQDAFLWNTASVSLNNVGTALFQNLRIRLENNIQAISKLDGRLRPDLLKRGDFRRITVNGQMIFQDFVQYDAFLSGSEVDLSLTFTGKVITTSANEILDIGLPRFRYSTYPINIGGPGPIQVGFTGRGMIDQQSLYSMDLTLVNTRQSPYSVNTTA